jgi:hypothetical protein
MAATPANDPTKGVVLPPGTRTLSVIMDNSYRLLLGEGLLHAPTEDLAMALYTAPFALLAHDGGEDPRFTYANLTAQQLWERDWDEFVGLPSRLSAEPDDRTTRASMLAEVARTGFIANYSGVRVSASGQRFRIADAQVWNLTDANGHRVGQAARIGTWHPLSR